MKHVSLAERVPVLLGEEAVIEREDVTVEETTVETDEDVISSQIIKETRTFHIVGVTDPRNQEQISIYQAIADGVICQAQGLYRNLMTGENVPIPEAMSAGLIQVAYTDRSVEAGELIKRGIIRTTTTKEVISYTVLNVLDPISGERIGVNDAIAKGIIDQHSGRYINPLTGDSMPLLEAVSQGFLTVEIAERKPRDDMVDGLIDVYDNNNFVENDIIVAGVKDPVTGKFISLEDAIEAGIVDTERGVYKNPLTGEDMTLLDAIQQGYLKARMVNPDKDSKLLNGSVLHIRSNPQQHIADIVPTEIKGLESIHIKSKNTNENLFDRLSEVVDTSKGKIINQETGDEMCLAEAFKHGLLCLDPMCIVDAAGDKYSLQEAAILGLVDMDTVRVLLSAMEDHSLDKLIQSGQLNVHTGDFVDPEGKLAMPLERAIEEGKIDPHQIFYTDLQTHNVSALSSAIENKKWDPETGQVIDPRTGQEMSPAKAIETHVIDPKVDANKLCNQISALKLLNSQLDTGSVGVKDSVTGEDISLEDAIVRGILDITHNSYVDHATGKTMSIPEAVDAKLIEPDTAKKIYGAMKSNTLAEAISQGRIDPNTGKFIHPETKRKMTIKEAIDQGLIDPSTIFFADPQNNEVCSLASFIESGRFNPVTGKFRDPLTNLEVSISNAIKKGLIDPSLDPDMFIEEKMPLQEILNSGKCAMQDAKFLAPGGQTMSIKDALANGFLTADSVVKVDPRTGFISVAEDEGIVRVLVATKSSLDWVEGIEASAASLESPCTDDQILQEQIDTTQVNTT